MAAGRVQLPRGWVVALALALLGIHFALAVSSKRHESTTSDELVHLTGGFSYWRFNDYRLHPENGNLPQRWAALPTYLRGATFPSLEQDYWRKSEAWVLGHEFFYETGEDHFPRLMAARAMIALFSVATGLLIFLWSLAWFGEVGGLLSLGLFCFSPPFLAHGALATSDVCMTFFLLAATGAWWRQLHDGSWGNVALSAVVFGLACVAKFSAVLLLPMFAVMAVAAIGSAQPLRIGRRSCTSTGQKIGAVAVMAAAHALVALVTIWAFYGFRYSAFNPGLPPADQFIRRWELIEAAIGWQGKLTHALAGMHALPEAFLYGYGYVIDSARARSAFLNGQYSLTGWWNFFPWTFLLKTTPAVLAATVAAAAGLGRRWWRERGTVRAALYRATPLLALFAVYWAFSLTSHLNIGHRHILPTYPVLFIAAGWLATRFGARRWIGILVAIALVGAQAVAAARIYPHYLAYFNPLGGGPAEGYRHLVDSSLDWGQDLPGLKDWLDGNAGDERVFLSYFGTGEPAYYGFRAERLVMVNGFKLKQPFVSLGAGVYCISATSLQQVYSPYRGDWTIQNEQLYQKLRAIEPALIDYAAHPEHQRDWEAQIPRQDWDRVQQTYEELRFARLCHFLRARAPDAQIGYSINIYRLSAADLAVATGPLKAWAAAIEAETRRRERP
jgi:hypothetical protein